MQLPLKSLYPTNDDSSAPPPQRDGSSLAQKMQGKGRIAYLYTSGSDIIGFQTRASVTDYLLRRAISGVGAFDDQTLADAYPASPTALACTAYTARKTASIPLRVLNARRDPLTISALDTFLDDAPDLIRHIAFSLRIWGRFYLRKRYNAASRPTGLEWINPALVREIPGRDGYIETYQIRDAVTGIMETVSVRDIVYQQEFDSRPGGVGLSAYEAAWRNINVQLGIVTYSAAWFVNSSTPDGIISFTEDPDEPTIDAVQAQIERQLKGVENAHRTVVLPGGAKYTPMQTTPKDTAQTETDERTVKHICSVFGVHPALIGLDIAKDPLGASTTYNSMEIAFMRDVAVPLLSQVILPALNAQWASRDFLDPYMLEVDRALIPEFTETLLSRSETAGALTERGLLDIDEARKMLGYEPRQDDLRIDPTKPLTMWQSGALTLDRFGQMTGILANPLGGGNGNVILIAGQPVPLDRVREYADAIVDKVKAEAALMGSSIIPSASAGITARPDDIIVTTEPTPQLEAGEPRADDILDTSLCIALDLSNHPDLIAMQRAVRQFCDKQGITADWNDPEEFHITLAHAAQCTEEQAQAVIARLAAVEVPDLSLHIGSLAAFESVGSYPLHLRIRSNDALLALQAACHDAMRDSGLSLSAYSAPDAYKPHITMGYADRKVNWTYKGGLRVKPSACLVWHGEGETLYEKPCGEPADLSPTAEPTDPVRNTRAVVTTTLALRFGLDDAAPNVHLAQACRTLDDALRAADQLNPDWVAPDAYALQLCDMPNAMTGAVSKLIRAVDLDDQRVIDLWTAGYRVDGLDVYLTFEPCEELSALQSALALEVEALGIERINPEQGVRLCVLKQEIDPAILPARCERLPLVAIALSLYRDASPRHTWALVGESEARRAELKAYGKRMARATGKPFVFEALRNHPAAAWLDDAREAGVSLDDAIEVARAILAGEDVHYLRAYPQTRQGFTTAVTDLFYSVNDGNMTRQKFGAQLRSLLRRYGLIAMRDGMNEVGYDPESLSQQEVAAFRAWQEQQSTFVSGLGDELFKERKVTGDNPVPLSEPALLHRAQMWADISLESARELGLYLAAPQEKYTWVMDSQAEHCVDCLMLNGKTYRMDEWIAADLTPTRGNTECKQGCRCSLKPNPSAKLSPLSLIGLTGSRRSEDDERDAEPDDGTTLALTRHGHGETCACTPDESMANDPQIRAENTAINAEFVEAEADGLSLSPNGDTADDASYDEDGQRAVILQDLGAMLGIHPNHTTGSPDLSGLSDEEFDDLAYSMEIDLEFALAIPDKYAHIDFKPTEAMADNARRALEVRAEKPESQQGMTPVGLARARDIMNRRNLSPDTTRRMKAYFDRHEVDKQGATWDAQGKGWQAWNGWGGDEGYAWARQRVESMNAADEQASS